MGIENDIKMNTGEVGSEIVNWRHLRDLEILTVAKDQAFWYVKRCRSIGEQRRFEPNLCAEEGGNNLLQNICNPLKNYKAPRHRKP